MRRIRITSSAAACTIGLLSAAATLAYGTLTESSVSAAAEIGVGAAHALPDGHLLGVFCGNSPDEVKEFEVWLGKKVDGVLGYIGQESWEDFEGSTYWAVDLWSHIDRRVLWSVPLITKGATLADAASGEYDEHYRTVANTLAAFRPQDPVIYVRSGWEFNGNWFPWSAHGKPNEFIGAFQRFVTVFRKVSPRFRFEWNVNIGEVGMDPETAYPGDAFVDIIGMDFYWTTDWDPKEATAAFNYMVQRKWGLKWHQAFAATHGKPTAYSEWGVMADDSASYIDHVQRWFADHPVIYQTYWNSDESFKGKLSDGKRALAGASFKAAFGGP
ncbi:MAG TPA: glycosyl hydrolase [Hyphomicrobium sp.]|nr:glycosyl hydrolase [Hyphomicrobium sp.]